MASKEDFINAGFSVVETEKNENRLLEFLKENYPQVIRDGELNLTELKATAGLPIDEKVNGYGLNFIGRSVARAKYAQETVKELKINRAFSKNFDTTQNMVLKGDNLDCLKILKKYYSGKIKCIYIDPPYNTDSDEFIYPDKFNKEEAEVLGLANLSETDMARLEFSFKTNKSHNGWLSFMYPRLLLARDLLSKDGVIFISIDDNEQANLKLLCDEIFGEENFITMFIWEKTQHFGRQKLNSYSNADYILCYAKYLIGDKLKELLVEFVNSDLQDAPLFNASNNTNTLKFPTGTVKFNMRDGVYSKASGTDYELLNPVEVKNNRNANELSLRFKSRWSNANVQEEVKKGTTFWVKTDTFAIRAIYGEGKTATVAPKQIIFTNSKNEFCAKTRKGMKVRTSENATNDLNELMGIQCFSYPKPVSLITYFINILYNEEKKDYDNDFSILDFFAGSGTTGHAVMELNKDGGNRKFILCQIDEPIDPKKKREAFDFCINNKLPPVISSITIERLKRAGEKIKEQQGILGSLDIGFKVFDTVNAPCLALDKNGMDLVINNNENDFLSRIYNMLFSVGIDNPATMPECVLENCLCKIGSNYYITNAAELDKEENKRFLSDAIKNGKVFIDGWTASVNTTLQNYKENVKIVC